MKTFVPFEFPFMDSLHEDHFNSALYEIGSTYPSIVAAIYLLSATRETRAHFWELVDHDGNIKDDLWDVWQDEDSRRCVALAVNLLYGDSYPVLSPAYLYDTPLASALWAAMEYWYRNRSSSQAVEAEFALPF